MNLAKAFSNNDVVLLVWTYEHQIPDCLGFCIERRNIQTNHVTTLQNMLGFKKGKIGVREFKDTNIWPIQKFNWRDFSAESGQTYVYTITPMIGLPDNLNPKNELSITTNNVKLSPGEGKIKAYFNRGILSTQFLASEIPKDQKGTPNYSILLERIKQPGDTLRNSLTDELKDALLNLFNRALKEGGECYCALYELNDPELISKILELKNKVHIILSNTGESDSTNQVSRATLHAAKLDIVDRMVGANHIGHNKFVIYVDKNGNPKSILSGSTNWTTTGLCAQSNNAIIIESDEVATHYMDYWKRMKIDGADQGQQFRKDNNKVRTANVDNAKVDIWFSPNTKAENKTPTSPAPEDLKSVFSLMNGAQKSILFLAFQPGNPSIIEQAANIQINNPNLFIRGAATDLESVNSNNVTLFHRGINDPVIVGAQELKDDFAYWMAELLKSSPNAHAIIHDKIVVIDAFTPNCCVIVGSHNLGYRASYNNDENMLIIKGDIELATSYATHILDIYDHYRWRYHMSKTRNAENKFKGLNSSPEWQNPYFNESRGESIDRRFWI
nr:phospholipase D-like domain-containing protein [uncultured Flavobacterium sp.]